MADNTYDLTYKSQPFTGNRDDWTAWRIRFEAIADVAGLRHHLTEKPPSDVDLKGKDMDGIKKVYRALVLCMPPHILNRFASLEPFPEQKPGAKIRNTPHPSDCWKILQDEYEGNTLAHRRQLKMKLFRLSMNAPAFKNDFPPFLAEINNICNRLSTMGAPVPDEDKLCVLVGGLPKVAEHAVGFLDSQQGYDFKKASDYLSNFFARLKVTRETETEVDQPQAYIVTGADGKPTRFCTHCKMTGHTDNICFKLHPELLATAPKCHKCGKPGHTAKKCKMIKDTNSKEPAPSPLVHFLEMLPD